MTDSGRDAERKWAEEQIAAFRAIRPRFEKYSEVLGDVLENVAQKHAPLAIVQTRPKAISSFAEKIQRKRSLYKDAIRDMTDLCGGRIITHTQAQVDEVCRFIEKNFEIDWENSCDVSQRLQPSEFGYLSVHYIVLFKKGVFPCKDVGVKIPESVYGLKAEIQVRTILQHAWADISHDLTYKNEIKLPSKWQREFATLAAVLEGADKTFSRIGEGLRSYSASYGAYLTEEKMREEIRKMGIVLRHDPANPALALRIGKLAITLGDWNNAIDVLSGFVKTQYPPVLRDLGVAICKKYHSAQKGARYRQGQKFLEKACELDPNDSDAMASLAGTWKGIDEDKVRALYRKAFEIDPTEPYPLVNYLVCEIVHQSSVSMISLLTPVIAAAIQKSRDQIDVRMNLPWAYCNIGKLSLLLGKPYESLSAYAMAVQLSTASFMIESSLDSLEKLAVVRKELPGYDWIKRLLLAGLVSKFGKEAGVKYSKELRSLASRSRSPMCGPFVILVGGCDPSVEKKMRSYRPLLLQAFQGFKGTIISGGTTSGISGLAGDIQAAYPENIRTVGYIPAKLPSGVRVDRRYTEIRRLPESREFSPLEPLQNWIDIIAGGGSLSDVKVLGIDGGRIAAIECRIALAMGATVAVVEGGGRETARVLVDEEWCVSGRLLPIPADPMTVRGFIGSGAPKMDRETREILGKAVHAEYQDNQKEELTVRNPSMKDWPELSESLRESNRQQADDICVKLGRINCELVRVENRDVSLMTFTKDEIEMLAEMEHARWNVERLLDGWRLGEKKDIDKKISPSLVSWKALPEKVREWDRKAVRAIPALLAGINLEIRRIK